MEYSNDHPVSLVGELESVDREEVDSVADYLEENGYDVEKSGTHIHEGEVVDMVMYSPEDGWAPKGALLIGDDGFEKVSDYRARRMLEPNGPEERIKGVE